MTVPFDQLAPGVKARAVMQVIGRRDSVLNPTGIRFLPLGDDYRDANVLSSPQLPDVATALAGIQLLTSAGTLALSAATLAEVQKLGTKVDQLLGEQKTTHSQLDKILKQLESLSLKVGEGRLATIVDHAVRLAAHNHDEISFAPFVDLAHDLEGFLQDAGVVRGMPVGLRLGSDLRASLRRICQLLNGVRLRVARQHNQAVGALDPRYACHQDQDYWSDADQMAVYYDDVGLSHEQMVDNRRGVAFLATS